MQRSRALLAALLFSVLPALAGCAGSLGHGKNLEEIQAAFAAEPMIQEFEVAFDTDGGGNYGTSTYVDILAPDLYAASEAERTTVILDLVHEAQQAADFTTQWDLYFWTQEEWKAKVRDIHISDEGWRTSLVTSDLFGKAFPAHTADATPYDGTFYENRLTLDPAYEDGVFREETLWHLDDPSWADVGYIQDDVEAADQSIVAAQVRDFDDEVNGVEHHRLELAATLRAETTVDAARLLRIITAALTADGDTTYASLSVKLGVDAVGPLDLTPAATELFGPSSEEPGPQWHPAGSSLVLREPNRLVRKTA